MVHKRAEKCVGAVCVKHSGSIVAGVCSLVLVVASARWRLEAY